MHLTSSELKTIREFFDGQPVLNAYLYGSYARKEARKESDVNILVELDITEEHLEGCVKMQRDLRDKLNKKIELVTTKGVSKYFLPFIEHDKKLLYKK